MRYAILILLAGCIRSGSVGTPEEGDSDVDGMELEGDDVPTIEPLGVLVGMAGMDDGAGGAGGSGVAGIGGDDIGSDGTGGVGADSGAGGTGGGEGPEAPVGAAGDACKEHSECLPPPQQPGYCYMYECIDRGDYDWVVDGGNCDFPWPLICLGWESGYRCIEQGDRRLCLVP